MKWTQEEIAEMRLADSEIDESFELTREEIAESKERDDYVLDGQLDFRDLRRQQYNRAYNKRYYATNKAALAEKHSDYRATHQSQCAQKEREWKQRNAEYVNAYQKAYYSDNREKILAKKRSDYEVTKAYRAIVRETEHGN